MRLKSIKLAGFKSFVDPTTVNFPSNMAAVVGPNGCGKSNIIDAVRWVMGESSAKNLRGESMADVIFNGSVNRQPVGQAAGEGDRFFSLSCMFILVPRPEEVTLFTTLWCIETGIKLRTDRFSVLCLKNSFLDIVS